jgi:subtilisin family serine protease
LVRNGCVQDVSAPKYFSFNKSILLSLLHSPGTDIMSAIPSSDWSYSTKSGTSMAAAHVSGAAALYLQRNPTMTPQQVRDALVNDAVVGRLLMPFDFFSPNKLLYTGIVGSGNKRRRYR